eukprot:3521193-Amphidinium_carterae.1
MLCMWMPSGRCGSCAKCICPGRGASPSLLLPAALRVGRESEGLASPGLGILPAMFKQQWNHFRKAKDPSQEYLEFEVFLKTAFEEYFD